MSHKKFRTLRVPGCEVDYKEKLDPAEKAWLKQFEDESIRGYFSKKKTRLHPLELKKEMRHERYARSVDVLALRPLPLLGEKAPTYSPEYEEAIDSIGEGRNLADFFENEDD